MLVLRTSNFQGATIRPIVAVSAPWLFTWTRFKSFVRAQAVLDYLNNSFAYWCTLIT